MKALRLPNGNLLVPEPFEFGSVVGTLSVEITPDDPRYAEWLPFVTADVEPFDDESTEYDEEPQPAPARRR